MKKGDMHKLGPVGDSTQGVAWDGKDQRNVYQLFISYDSVKLVGLQVQYMDKESSSLLLSDVYGKMSGSNFRAIEFDYPAEYITWLKIDGSWDSVVRLAMKTNLGKCFGPFPFESDYNINDEMLATGYYLGEKNQFGGFYGTADKQHGLYSLGVYVQPVLSLDKLAQPLFGAQPQFGFGRRL
ncbi:unnamed protein product [Rhodiola kirilowii]